MPIIIIIIKKKNFFSRPTGTDKNFKHATCRLPIKMQLRKRIAYIGQTRRNLLKRLKEHNPSNLTLPSSLPNQETDVINS